MENSKTLTLLGKNIDESKTDALIFMALESSRYDFITIDKEYIQKILNIVSDLHKQIRELENKK